MALFVSFSSSLYSCISWRNVLYLDMKFKNFFNEEDSLYDVGGK